MKQSKRLLSAALAAMMAASAIPSAAAADLQLQDSGVIYAYQNIPYSAFYSSLNDDGDVDVVSSATAQKAAGCQNVYFAQTPAIENGTTINGVVVPVAMTQEEYDAAKEAVTDSSADYYVGDTVENPALYLTKTTDGGYEYASTNEEQTKEVTAKLSTNTVWGNYEIDLTSSMGTGKMVSGRDGETEATGVPAANVYGAYLTTTDGAQYAMKQSENLWTPSDYYEVSFWTVDGATDRHGAPQPTNYYKSFEGKTVASMTYITDEGLITADFEDQYAAPQFTGEVSAAMSASELTLTGLPDDIENAKATISTGSGRQSTTVASDVEIADGKIALDFTPNAETAYTVKITSDNYASFSTTAQVAEEDTMMVMMNIPYSAFYKADVSNSVDVDVFTSATKNKAATTLAAGTYREADNSVIYGVTYPVKITKGTDLSAYTKTTAEDIATAGDYAYYEYTGDAPKAYKIASVTSDGISFTAVKGDVTEVSEKEGVTAALSTNTNWGDYQLDVSGLFAETDREGNVTKEGVLSSDAQTYAAVVTTSYQEYDERQQKYTTATHSYGMRALENLWRNTEIAWCTGFTDNVHGCPTSSAHYASMMGETITGVTYYTSEGIYKVTGLDIYVPVKFEGSISASAAKVSEGQTTVDVQGLPEDFAPEYTFSGDLDASVKDGVITYSKETKPGSYTVTVSDTNGKYDSMSASFNLTVDANPAAYDKYDAAVVAADGASAEDVSAYLSAINSIKVTNAEGNTSNYNNNIGLISTEDGTINAAAANNFHGQTSEVFPAAGTYTITTSALGYLDESFEVTIAVAEDGTKSVVKAEQASNKITVAATKYTKVNGNKAFSLGASAKTDLTYATSNSKVAAVSKSGKVTIKGVGTAKITISAAATKQYKAATKTVTITVNPRASKVSSAKSSKKGRVVVKVAKVAGATGYQVKVGTKTVTTKSRTVTVKGQKSGKKLKVTVRAYQKVSGKTYYSSWSSAKTVKVK